MAASSLPVCVVPVFLGCFAGTLLRLPVGILPVVVPGLPALLRAVLVVGRHLGAPIVPTVRALLGRVICHGPAVTAGGLLGLQRSVTAKGFPEVPGHGLTRTALIAATVAAIHVLVALTSTAETGANKMRRVDGYVAAAKVTFFKTMLSVKMLVGNLKTHKVVKLPLSYNHF